MIDERAYELLCCQLGLANEEKAGLRKQVNELIARLKAIEDEQGNKRKFATNIKKDIKTLYRYAQMFNYLNRNQILASEAIYIGDTEYDSLCAHSAGVDFGLALWG